jgi:hypothetical protein
MFLGTIININYAYYAWMFMYDDLGGTESVSTESIKQAVLQYGHKGRDLLGIQFIPIVLMLVATIWSCRRTTVAKKVAEQVGAPNPLPVE